MRKYRALLINDIRHAGLDPVLMAGILGPLALLFLSRFGFSIAEHWLEDRYAFHLGEYRGFAASFLITVIPMLIGMMTGLLMLDERDEEVIAYYAVTPLMRKGYMVYRLFLPSILCTVLSSLYLLFSGIAEISLESLYVLLLLALEAPCFALFLSAFAANKVEGLALSKLGGLFIAGPVVAYFVPGGWQLLGAWIPSYWPAKTFLEGMGDRHLAAFSHFALGLLIHVFLLMIMVKVFIKRVD
ncbi:hypothetical protein [Paenibacillus wynnii]|uniref:hypothetical protein n=1 Tax=Paenibacillus wynnii TaxID=268407 RepID=UPI002794B4FE|nr:hypothetical protein [Paenibacillus wynnii]MDQ0196611.1 fluoroquinolone transport system permease protein [Paenibacillus wynnii]